MSEFRKYMRKGLSEMRPYIEGEDLSAVSVNNVDTPAEGGMIARNPKYHDDQWYVAAEYFNDNLTEVVPNFESALIALKKGRRVAREGWNGKGMFIFLTKGRTIPNDKQRSFKFFDGDTVVLADHIDMRAADGSFVSGWLASQTDMLAEDWVVLED